MGVIAGFAHVPPDRWPAVLGRLADEGVQVEDEGESRGTRWYSCTRGKARCGLAFMPDPGDNVCCYAPARRAWGRPVAFWRLSRAVWRAIRAEAG